MKYRVRRYMPLYYEYIIEASCEDEAREIGEAMDYKLPLDLEEDMFSPVWHKVLPGEHDDVLCGLTTRELERVREIYKKYKPQVDIEE